SKIREIAVSDKLQYSYNILSSILPVVKQIYSDQCSELELESRLRGTKVDIPRNKTCPSMKETEENQKGVSEEPPKDYVHVRARRGEATDSHSLAERVRRERISERLKMLQGLIPGCDKVSSKALIEPEETKEPEEGDIVAAEYTGSEYGGVTDCQTPTAGDQWSSEVAAGNWGSEAPPSIAAVSVANEPEWTAADQAPLAGEWDTATALVAAAAVTEVAPSTGWD
ncbi:hypothetical protein GIB67_038834, partial [Kingdonia uniflora]